MRIRTWLITLLLLGLNACNRTALLSAPAPATVTITIVADGESHLHTTSAATVSDALSEAQIQLDALDLVRPGEYLALKDGMVITVVRVVEEFQALEVETPFGKQTVRNEGLPEGERFLLQSGHAGREEVVYRIEYHDGVEVERRIVRRAVLEEAADDIEMIGVKGSIVPTPIQGTLAYISGGNGLVMRGSSANRRPVANSGDLDGQVFALSPDGRRLLYTRSVSSTLALTHTLPAFNSLWVISATRLSGQGFSRPEPLEVDNVLWAGWSPNGKQIAYSTGSPTDESFGWAANNDVWIGGWNSSGHFQTELLTRMHNVGSYGLLGSNFAWSPNGRYLAYGQTDQVGFIDIVTGREIVLARFSVYSTHPAWVWTPIPTWSPDTRFIASVVYDEPVGPPTAEDRQYFDLWVWDIHRPESPVTLASDIGMWGMPAWSPGRQVGNELTSQIAFLETTDPRGSANARYALWVMDRDGSDARSLFPLDRERGLRPQPVAWSPQADQIVCIFDGDLLLVNVSDGVILPLTGDRINSNPVWVALGAGEEEWQPIPDLMDIPID